MAYRASYGWLSISILLGACPAGGSGPSGTARGLDDGPWDPEMCTAEAQQRQFPGTCTQADFDTWNQCLIDACQDVFATCYGPNYRSGTFAGACGAFAQCASRCACNDGACTAACPGAQACADCLTRNVCGGDCEEPRCALAGSGIDGSKTCEDLRVCCIGLRDADGRQRCIENVDMLAAIPGGEYSCASLYGLYTTTEISTTCTQ